jgi:hypothetical protein
MILLRLEQPPNSGGAAVSAHMEYQAGDLIGTDRWLPVPTTTDPLGESYRSEKYQGLRDYVRFDQGVSKPTIRQICLFMPHTAAAIPVGRHFVRRYVVRLWDDNGDEIEIKALPLPPEDVVMDRDENR